MVARAIPDRKRVGLHYIANLKTPDEEKGLTAMSDPKNPSITVSVTKIG